MRESRRPRPPATPPAPCSRALRRGTRLLAIGWTACAFATPVGAQEPTSKGWVQTFADPREDLDDRDVERRLRAIERLGASRTAQSTVALVDAVKSLSERDDKERTVSDDDTSKLGRAARARLRLGLARALAAHRARPEARQGLVRLMTSATESSEPRDAMALSTAALALAQSRTVDAWEALGRALWQSATLASAAREALLAYPPADLGPLLAAGGSSLALLDLLGELGDERAYDFLSEVVRTGAPARAARAALALGRLGFPETTELARHWWTKSPHAAHRRSAALLLLEARDPMGGKALSELLRQLPTDAAERRALFEVAARAPQATAEEPLLALTRGVLALGDSPTLDEQESALALLALARLDTPRGTEQLLRALSSRTAVLAASALADTEGPRASAALVEALRDRARRAWALRVLAARVARGKDSQRRPLVVETARRWLAPSTPSARLSPTDLSAAAWALALTAPKEAAALLASTNAVVVRAVARQAYRGPLAVAATQRLASSRTERALPLLHGLQERAALEGLATRTLREVLDRHEEELGPGALPPFVRALTTRLDRLGAVSDPVSSEFLGSDVRAWLASSYAPTRAATALGLGAAQDPSGIALLADLLTWDPEPRVRRAAAFALAQRREEARRGPLALAASLDPDERVRRIAGAALKDSRPAPPSLTLVWQTADRPLALVTPSGETIVTFPDPDGFVGVVGPWDGPVEVEATPVAKTLARGEASRDR